MASDKQIRLPDGVAPQSYTVPNATEIVPLSINATFDGSGAGGSYVPTVEIVSDGGVVVARVPCQTTVAAGDSCECTFAPFLRGEAAATGAATAPSVATFYRSTLDGDPALTVPAAGGGPINIPWLHAALPSDGSVTGPIVGDVFIQVNIDCITVEFLSTEWDGTGYLKAAIMGTDSRIIRGDQYALGTEGDSVTVGTTDYGAQTQFTRPNAHIAGDLIHCYADNGDAADHDLNIATFVVYVWPAPGYSGGIPGWPQ